jgi:hypothetical protein
MRIELWLLLIAGLVIANIYTEGRYLKNWTRYKKYLQMAGVAVGALFLYFLLKKNPMKTGELLQATNDYLKYMPLDKGSAAMLSPILDFTAKQNLYQGQRGVIGGGGAAAPAATAAPDASHVRRMMQSGKKATATKRSVSETKKKFVAARQNWRCNNCQQQLTAWFEVDHKIRLEYGGSNHVDNLCALCRECHSQKTGMENMNKDML